MQQIRIDFDNPGLPQSLGAVEGESQSRIFQAALYKSGAAYTAPAGAVYSIMYRGFGPQNQGWYDTIEDGAGKRAACTVSGNIVTCELARQALRVPGHLTVVLCLTDAKGYMLKSWPIMADVRNDGYEDTGESEMYFNLSGIAGNYLAQLEKAMADAETTRNNLISTSAQAKKDIDAKAAAALKSIPESYTELDGNVKQLKEDLVSEQDDGLFHRYLTWEHGGIDNATGENNNDGSTTRSRTTKFLLCKDYKKIVNLTNKTGFIIYYNNDKSFFGAVQITANNTINIESSSNKVYFKLDFRASLGEAYKLKLYEKSILTKEKAKLDAKENIQIYFYNDYGVVEESKSTKKLYLGCQSINIRYGSDGSAIIYITNTITDISTQTGLPLETSPNGYSNCIAIPDEHGLVFDLSDRALKIVNRLSLTDNHIIIAVQNGGYVTDACPYILALLSKNKMEIPDYWNSAIYEAETSINKELASDDNSKSFAFLTDTHIGNNNRFSGMLMEKVMSDCHIPVWFHGGDAVTGKPIISGADIIKEMDADFKQFTSIENIGLRAIGNHDPVFGVSANYDSNLINGEINHYYHGVDREKYLQVYGSKKGYFYKDIVKDKLRCIVLDIIPYESQVTTNELVNGANKLYYHQFGSEQLNWFASVLEDTPVNYSVVVCSHIAPVSLTEFKTLDNSWSETVPIDYVQARKISEAYAQKSSYNFNGTITGDKTGDNYNINVDFSIANGDFVCWFCGHTHKDFMLKLDNINIVGTANDSITVSSNAPSYAPLKTSGTNTEQIMDFFCIKPTTKEVSIVRLGAYLKANGKVRTFSY